MTRVIAKGLIKVAEKTGKEYKKALKRQSESVVGYICTRVPCSL